MIKAFSAHSLAGTDFAGIALAGLIGLSLLFVAGFSHAHAMHDVAHDSRHAVAFPCH